MSEVKRRAQYTLEFKQQAVRLVEAGQSIASVARTLGVADSMPTPPSNIQPWSWAVHISSLGFTGKGLFGKS